MEISSLKGEYVTLSYVWGGVDKGITTKENLPQRYGSISLDSLCKTDQDAITVTRRFGFEYLWIDALCIIQDDKSDWEKESAKMCNIYRDSVLTLVASSSTRGDQGMFSARPRRFLAETAVICGLRKKEDPADEADYDIDLIVSKLEADPEQPNEMLDTALLIEDAADFNGPFVLVRKPVLSHGLDAGQYHKYYTSEDFPLEDRAWCFQERILSTRIVHFAKEELVWECNYGIACECWGMNREGEKTLRQDFQDLGQLKDSRLRGDGWMDIVKKCTSRKLTKQSDRLPTLSGLARSLQEKGFGEYVAGLWNKHLPAQLLWKAFGSESRRVVPYQAPTWSFASLESCAIHNGLEHLFRTRRQFLVTIKSTMCWPAGADPNGNVLEASTTLNGPVQHSSLEFRGFSYKGKMSNKTRCKIMALGKPRAFSYDLRLLEHTKDLIYDKVLPDPPETGSSMRPHNDEEEFFVKRNGLDGSNKPVEGKQVLLLAICNEEQIQMKTYGKGLHFALLSARAQTTINSRVRPEAGLRAHWSSGAGPRWGA